MYSVVGVSVEGSGLSDSEALLIPHHDDIVAWRAEGIALRIIAGRLRGRGMDTHFNVVGRYCTKADIPQGQRVKPQPPPVQVEPPAAMKPAEGPSATATPPTPKTEPDSTFRLVDEPDISGGEGGSEQNLSAGADSESADPINVDEAPNPAGMTEWQSPPLPFARLGVGPWWTADLPMLEFGEDGADVWSLQDACEGTFIVGTTGSGKTSGSGATLARSFLERGFGGLVLTAKEDERRTWERYAAQCGRSQQLCIVEPGGPLHLNFLDYEANRPGKGAGLVENLVNLLYAIVEAHTRNEKNESAASFWESTGKQLLRNALRILQLVRPRITLADIIHFITESPNNPERVTSGNWVSAPCFGGWLRQAIQKAKGTPHERVVEEARRYWLDEFAKLNDKTRSCIVTGMTARQDGFVEPVLHDLFCTDTTLTPDMATQGAIILIDLPVKEFGTVGLFSQMAWKYLFQLAVERRTDANDATRRPVFLWADEAQLFYSSRDSMFQATARSSRCATVYLTQNLPAFYGLLGSGDAHDKVNGFLGNLNTKIFHNNNDPATNQWAAEMIGKSIQYRFSSNSSTSRKSFWDFNPTVSQSGGMQEVIDYEVQPNEFIALRKGGPRNDRQVDAYFLVSGAQFSATGKHYFKTVFLQE